MKSILLLFGVLTVVFLSSCETTFYDEIENRANSAYFPFQEGKFRLYQLDSIRFYPDGPNTVIDTTSGILKVEFRNVNYESTSHVKFEIWRTYTSDFGSESQTEVWSGEIENGKWYQNERNLRFFLINFDAEAGDRWESVLFNPSDVTETVGQSPILPYIEWESRLVTKEEEVQIENFEFTNVLHLERAALTNSLLELRMNDEWYAEEVGLVKSERWILDTQCITCPEDDWAGKAEIGYIVNQRLLEYN